jgi:uncharacterized protein YggE
MKHEGLVIGLLVIAVACSVAGLVLTVAHLPLPSATVAATGTAQKTFVPDTAHLDLGVQTDATVVQKAQQDNAVTMKSVVAALKSAGVKDADIQTSSFWVNQNYEYSSGQSVPAGWRVSNSVTVTAKPEMISSLIDAASKAGANIFNSVTFDVTNREELKAGLMQEAVANARAKARGTLEGTTHSLGDMQTIEADWSGPSIVYPTAGAGGADTGAATVETGTNMLSVSVSVRFKLK